ncbi:hypothetical protein [Candidatus Nanohalococcus occultus]|uniref:hypothetical protein n=1 Tax=Candidatus Nanohalococcus occultus TaxID=2978047 RepID=UPI0039E181ED
MRKKLTLAAALFISVTLAAGQMAEPNASEDAEEALTLNQWAEQHRSSHMTQVEELQRSILGPSNRQLQQHEQAHQQDMDKLYAILGLEEENTDEQNTTQNPENSEEQTNTETAE